MAETFNTTLMVLKVNRPLPIFTMEREKAYEKLFDRMIALTGYTDIKVQDVLEVLQEIYGDGPGRAGVAIFLYERVVQFFEDHQISHVESNGEALLIFNKLKLARTDETLEFIEYGRNWPTYSTPNHAKGTGISTNTAKEMAKWELMVNLRPSTVIKLVSHEYVRFETAH